MRDANQGPELAAAAGIAFGAISFLDSRHPDGQAVPRLVRPDGGRPYSGKPGGGRHELNSVVGTYLNVLQLQLGSKTEVGPKSWTTS